MVIPEWGGWSKSYTDFISGTQKTYTKMPNIGVHIAHEPQNQSQQVFTVVKNVTGRLLFRRRVCNQDARQHPFK
jgi:hypothetical protein